MNFHILKCNHTDTFSRYCDYISEFKSKTLSTVHFQHNVHNINYTMSKDGRLQLHTAQC